MRKSKKLLDNIHTIISGKYSIVECLVEQRMLRTLKKEVAAMPFLELLTGKTLKSLKAISYYVFKLGLLSSLF